MFHRTLLLAAICCAAAPATQASQTHSPRIWTDHQGRKVEASHAGTSGDKVLLKLPDGRTIPFSIDKLSKADQLFLGNQAAAKPALVAEGFPDRVEVPAKSVEVTTVGGAASDNDFRYQSAAFEFTSQAKLARSVMSEVAETFEATRLLVRQLPWSIDAVPPVGKSRYEARLFSTREDYVRAGGPANSGGVFRSDLQAFLVPFESIGLEKRGQTYYKSRDFRNDTLVHEITHQIMAEALPFLPLWVAEGTAEYTEALPTTPKGFLCRQHAGGMKAYVKEAEKRLDKVAIPDLQAHMTMTETTWRSLTSTPDSMFTLYVRSYLLVYFFNHLDGDGKGTRFSNYMAAVANDARGRREFFANPAVQRLPDGRFTYPADLAPPATDNPFKHLPLLLDGRGYGQLAQEIERAYKSMGLDIKVS